MSAWKGVRASVGVGDADLPDLELADVCPGQLRPLAVQRGGGPVPVLVSPYAGRAGQDRGDAMALGVR